MRDCESVPIKRDGKSMELCDGVLIHSFKFCKRSCLKLSGNKSQRKEEEEKI